MEEQQQEETLDTPVLSRFATALINYLPTDESHSQKGGITVNPLISKVATWYEKLRNAMDYREEEVVLRAAIERILKRRLLLGGSGLKTAEPLIRELIWAHYFPQDTLSEESIEKIAQQIDIYLKFRSHLLAKKEFKEGTVTEWMYQLMSSTIERLLNRKKEKELMNNFMYQVMRENIEITDDSEQNRDIQVFIAVRRSFAKDDLAFLRYHLFMQYFDDVSMENIEEIANSFKEAFKEIRYQLNYPRKEAIYSYVKRKTAVFFVLEDLLFIYKGNMRQLVQNREELQKAVYDACKARYAGIAAKVRRAIIRSVLFILLTKAFFAFAVEGTFESIVYGKILWLSIVLNTTIPPLLMIIVSFFIRIPSRANSERVFNHIQTVLFNDTPRLGAAFITTKARKKTNPFMDSLFTILWLLAFVVAFGIVILVLTRLHLNIISQGIFLFFLAIVSFLTYRIHVMSKVYSVDERLGYLTPVVDFFFMPIIRVGQRLTEGISQVNIFIFLFDFIIETPFKGLFGFFEQWFVYLHTKREGLE